MYSMYITCFVVTFLISLSIFNPLLSTESEKKMAAADTKILLVVGIHEGLYYDNQCILTRKIRLNICDLL